MVEPTAVNGVVAGSSPAVPATWPEWMPIEILAAYIGKKPATIKTLMSRGAIPRPFQSGKITLWRRQMIDLWLIRGIPTDQPKQEESRELLAKRAKDIRKSMRRLHIVPKISRDGGK